MSESRTFLVCPWYSGIDGQTVVSILQATQKHSLFTRVREPDSLLALGFNSYWCEALNKQAELGLTHVAMIHADIQAPPLWLDLLHEEMQRTGAAVLSCVIAIKDGGGRTSTAVLNGQTREIVRLTLAQTHALAREGGGSFAIRPGLPYEDGQDILCVNTGLWLADLSHPCWREKDVDGKVPHFSVMDDIAYDTDKHLAEPRVIPEDWNLSVQLACRGVPVWATHVVMPVHLGRGKYPSDTIWGTANRDTLAQLPLDELLAIPPYRGGPCCSPGKAPGRPVAGSGDNGGDSVP